MINMFKELKDWTRYFGRKKNGNYKINNFITGREITEMKNSIGLTAEQKQRRKKQ